MKKGDVLGVARIAGIMAAKKTSELVPLCHPIMISRVSVDVDLVHGSELEGGEPLDGEIGRRGGREGQENIRSRRESKGDGERANGNGRLDRCGSLHGILSERGSDLGNIRPKDSGNVHLDVRVRGIAPGVVETSVGGRVGRDTVEKGQDGRAAHIPQTLSDDEDQTERNPYRRCDDIEGYEDGRDGEADDAEVVGLGSVSDGHGRVEITATVECEGKTGVEMEALTAAAVAAMTVYDMCKSVDKGMRVDGLRVVRKEGGKSGTWVEGKSV